jgi:hypothetical protein
MLEKELELDEHPFHLLELGSSPMTPMEGTLEEVVHQLYAIPDIKFAETHKHFHLVELNGQQVAPGRYLAIQRNLAIMHDFK